MENFTSEGIAVSTATMDTTVTTDITNFTSALYQETTTTTPIALISSTLSSTSKNTFFPTTKDMTTTVLSTVISDNVDDIPREVILLFQGLHTALTILALLLNCLSLAVIYGAVARLNPPLQLLTSLAFTDMLAPWAIMTMYFPESVCQEEIHTALLLTAHNSGSATLMVLAICHSIATFKPLQYEKIVSKKRIWICINLIWITAIICAHIHFLVTVIHWRHDLPFCVQVQHHLDMAIIMAAALATATFVVVGSIYLKIIAHLKPIEALTSATERLAESRKSTRSVTTGLILAALYMFAWIPYIVTKFEYSRTVPHESITVKIGLKFCQLLILVACIADPVVYGIRMTNIHTGYYRIYQRCRGWANTTWQRIAGHEEQENDLPSAPLNPIESVC